MPELGCKMGPGAFLAPCPSCVWNWGWGRGVCKLGCVFGLGQQPWGWPEGELDTWCHVCPFHHPHTALLGSGIPPSPWEGLVQPLPSIPQLSGARSVSCSCSAPSSACAGAEQAAPLWAAQGPTVPPIGLGC